MASAKALFGALVGRFLFREATVRSVRAIGPSTRTGAARLPAGWGAAGGGAVGCGADG